MSRDTNVMNLQEEHPEAYIPTMTGLYSEQAYN
jgi:hypothetical protein